MGFIPETCPPYCGHSRFDRLERDAVLHFARSSAFPPGQASYDEPPNEVGWTTKHLIRGRSGSPHLWGCSTGNSLYFHLADCCRRTSSIGMFIFSDVRRRSTREPEKRLLLPPYWLADFPADRYYASGRWSDHYSMIFPLPLLAFVFLAKSLYTQFATENLRRLAVLLFGSAALCLFVINVHNTAVYLFHFRTNSHYNPRWSPEIYSLSDYISEHGFEAKSVICVDWGLHNQLHALAPKKLRRRMHDFWPAFKELGNKNWEKQSAVVNHIFPKGKSLVLTFAASKETFPETRRNFLDSLSTHPELKSHLVKEFRFAREKIYELYEIFRPPDGASQIRHAAPTATAHANRFAANSDGLDCHRMSSGTQRVFRFRQSHSLTIYHRGRGSQPSN